MLHDYGTLVTDKLHYKAPGVSITDIRFTDTPIDGGVRVGLRSIEASGPGGKTFTVAVDGECIDASFGGRSKHLCVPDEVGDLLGLFSHSSLTAAQKSALQHLASGLFRSVGIDVARSGGSWYLTPVRTVLDLLNGALGGLQGDDMKHLLELIGH